MGKHSATDGQDDRDSQDRWEQDGWEQDRWEQRIPDSGGFVSGGPIPPATPGTGRRRRGPADDSDYFAPLSPYGLDGPEGPDEPRSPRDPAEPPLPYDPDDSSGSRPGHPDRPDRPEHPEHNAWGTPGAWSAARSGRRDLPFDPVEEWAEDWAPYDTASALSSPAAHGSLPRHGQVGRMMPRPRQEFVDAFDQPSPRLVSHPPPGTAGSAASGDEGGSGTDDSAAPAASGAAGRGRTRALTAVAAATALAAIAVLAGTQLHRGHRTEEDAAPSGDSGPSAEETSAAPSTPSAAPATASPASYDEQMARQYPLDPHLSLSGAFTTVPGHQAAPGKGKVMRFRVDVEKGLDLDPRLFSDAVFTTLNDARSWGHGGTMTFERVSSGPADIVVTLASPGTTAKWCAKSGLDTTVDNVSCDAASTPRTMINAYRWARGAATYGPDRMHAYRQMLVNHEVGHRLGHNHVGCPREGAPAPVMMQQTKFLSLDGGPTCTPNPWPFP